MSNIMKELKAEISRLARKEIKEELVPVKRVVIAQRSLIAGLRRQNDAMQKELNALKKAVPAPAKALSAKSEPEGRFWITGKGVRKLRQRLGLTQAVFGKLVEVSMPTVVNWEKAEGKIDIRKKATMARLQEIKGKGKKEVAEILGVETASEQVKAPKKAKKAKKTKGPKAPKAPKAPKKAKAPKAPKTPKAVEKVEEKAVVETPAEVKKD